MIKEFRRYIREYWAIAELSPFFFALNLLTAIAYKALAIAIPFVSAMIIKSLTDQNPAETYRNIAIFAGVAIGHRLMFYFNWRAYSWNVNYSYRRIHDKIFDKLTTVGDDFPRKIPKGAFMNTINNDVVAVGEMADELAEFFTTPLQVAIIFIIVFNHGWVYAVIFLISCIIYHYVKNQADRNYNFFWQKTRREDDRYSTFLGQVANGLQEVKTFHMLPKLHQKLGRIQTRYNKLYQKQSSERIIRDNDSDFIYYAFQAILYLVLIIAMLNGQVALDILILIVSYHESITTYLDDFNDACMDIRLSHASVLHIKAILDYRPEKEFVFGDISIDELEGQSFSQTKSQDYFKEH